MKKYLFDQIIVDSTSKFHKIKKEDYLPTGQYKIVDQSKDFIAGYTNDKELVNSLYSPLIIFGDHTKIFKYVDFPLALGADGAKALTIKNNLADSKYLYYYFKTLKINDAGYSRHFKFLKEVSIPLPENYADQIRIAAVLSRAEKLIARRKESIKALDELLKSTFLEMFGDPVRNEKGWERVPLSKLGSLDRGVSKHRPRNAPQLLGGKYPLIQTGEVSNSGTYITEYSQTYSELGFKQSKMWKAGTLCITIAANIAKTGILTFDACFPDSVVGFTVDNNEAHILYIHHLFGFFQMILEKNAPKAAQKNINLDILRNLQVPKPPLPLQAQFSVIVEKVELLKARSAESLAELENLYGSLSQRAFKGELDLSKTPEEKESKYVASDLSNIRGLTEWVNRNKLLNEHTKEITKSFEALLNNHVTSMSMPILESIQKPMKDLTESIQKPMKDLMESIQKPMKDLLESMKILEPISNEMFPKYLETSFASLNKMAESLKPIDYPAINNYIFEQELRISKPLQLYFESVKNINQAMRSSLMLDTITKASQLIEPWSEEYICEKIKEDFKDKQFTIQEVLDLTKISYEVPSEYEPYQVIQDNNGKLIGLKELFFKALAKKDDAKLKLQQVYVEDTKSNTIRVMLEVIL